MDLALTIDGRRVVPSNNFAVLNPATGAELARCPAASRAELDEAFASAARAFETWRRDPARKEKLRACAGAVMEHVGELSRLLTAEQGKPLKMAQYEMQITAHWLKTVGEIALPTEVLQDDDKLRVEAHRRPVGVVAAITPWNYPVFLAAAKIAPALAAGNTMVLKPSPYTPLTTLRLGEILAAILPPGVLNVVAGDDSLGALMTEHPVPRKISFTGSVATGKKVAASAASDLKRVTLELGGNDPAIVLDDVDVQQVARKLFSFAFMNSGQVCIAIKRLYVAEKIYEPMLEALAEIARGAKVGDGMDPETELGPLNNRPQLERVCELVDDAVRSGGRALTGGKRMDRPGWFFPPTIVADVAEGTRLVDEEQFGPALPVLPFRTVDEAVARANATHFGLGASVWTSDASRGASIAGELASGTAWINHHVGLSPTIPFGGLKWSGLGVENGRYGLESFTDLQVIHVPKS